MKVERHEFENGLPYEKVIGIVTNFSVSGQNTHMVVPGTYEEFQADGMRETIFVATCPEVLGRLLAPSRTVLAFIIEDY